MAQTAKDDYAAKIEKQRRILLNSLWKLEHSNHKFDLKTSIKRKDFRFLGYYGITTIVPGIQGGVTNPYVRKKGLNVIPGTSDVIRSDDSRRLNRVVARYVIPYNKSLLAYLRGCNK